MKPLNQIKLLSRELPHKDAALAEQFIEHREFEKLLELVDSDIYMVQKNESLEHPKEKFQNIELDKLVRLRVAISEYLAFLMTPDNYEGDYGDY